MSADELHVEKLIIDGKIHHGPKTECFLFHGRLLQSGSPSK